MINIKYKDIYDKFISYYENIHVDPWHEISKEKLNIIYNDLVNKLDIDNEYNFKYFIDYIIKRLSGKSDAHTKYENVSLIPINFKIFDDEVLVNYPDDIKGSKLLSINDISISDVFTELDDIITYGTYGKRKYELEKALFNRMILFGLPSFRNSEVLEYKIQDTNGNLISKSFSKNEKYEDLFDYDSYQYGNNATYYFKDNCLIYNHSSVQNKFKDKIESAINSLEYEDLSNIDTIIIDLRGNFGGNSSLNKLLIDYLTKHNDKKLICLTDYRIFSGGRYALRDLIKIGATTIGDEISTPINCFGNSKWVNIDSHYFSISECYFHPFIGINATSKEEYKENITEDVKIPYIFKPDILVREKKEDYINNIDSVLEYAIEYSKSNNIHLK